MTRNVKNLIALFIDEQQQRSSTRNDLVSGLLRFETGLRYPLCSSSDTIAHCLARWKGKFHSLLGRVDDQQEAVINDGLAILVGDLQRLAIQENANSTIPLRVPGFIGNLLSIRIEPGDIHLHDIRPFFADRAVLKKLPAMKFG